MKLRNKKKLLVVAALLVFFQTSLLTINKPIPNVKALGGNYTMQLNDDGSLSMGGDVDTTLTGTEAANKVLNKFVFFVTCVTGIGTVAMEIGRASCRERVYVLV